jgi:single-strand DNA-binding protein
MSLEIEGILRVKFDTQQVKDSFQKREFVVETKETYPQKVKFELTQEKCSLLDGFKEGDQLHVSFNIRGNEWSGKYFVNLQAWKIDKAGTVSKDQEPPEPMDDDMLPF